MCKLKYKFERFERYKVNKNDKKIKYVHRFGIDS